MKTIYMSDAQMARFAEKIERKYPWVRKDNTIYTAEMEGVWRVRIKSKEEEGMARGFASVLMLSEREKDILKEILWTVKENPLAVGYTDSEIKEVCSELLKSM